LSDDGNYEIGYGKPPKSCCWQKGQSGNPNGRRKKLLPTIAKIIDDAWMEMVGIDDRGEQRKVTNLELILLQLSQKIAECNRKAYGVRGKYLAYAKTKPRLEVSLASPEESSGAFREFLNNLGGKPQKKLAKAKLTPEMRRRRKRALDLEKMRARDFDFDAPFIPSESPVEAAERYELLLKQLRPVQSKSSRRTGKLVASEIADKVLFGPVMVNAPTRARKLSRTNAMVKVLMARAVRGDIGAADMLMIMHRDSVKYGDFVAEIKYLGA
jgi:hypothetical protein